MVLLMITSFLTAWLGYALVCFLRLMGVYVSPMAVAWAMLLAKVGGLLNAIVFVFMNGQVSNLYLSVIAFVHISMMTVVEFRSVAVEIQQVLTSK